VAEITGTGITVNVMFTVLLLPLELKEIVAGLLPIGSEAVFTVTLMVCDCPEGSPLLFWVVSKVIHSGLLMVACHVKVCPPQLLTIICFVGVSPVVSVPKSRV